MKRLKILGLISVFAFSLVFVSVARAQEGKEKKVEQKLSDTQKKLEKLLEEAEEEVEKEAKKKAEVKSSGMEIDGLIINETKTKIGQEFYEVFYTVWEPPEGIKNYTIFISEKGAGQWGSWVLLKVNETLTYQNRLIPRSEEIGNAAKYAVELTKNFLLNYEQYQKQLEGKDMKGTGIY